MCTSGFLVIVVLLAANNGARALTRGLEDHYKLQFAANEGDEGEADIIELLQELEDPQFDEAVQDLTVLFLHGANLPGSVEGRAWPLLRKSKCGWRCPGCCVDKVLPREISCPVQRKACEVAARGCLAACTAAAGTCALGCNAAEVVCKSRVCI
jgi:hypothetical protein